MIQIIYIKAKHTYINSYKNRKYSTLSFVSEVKITLYIVYTISGGIQGMNQLPDEIYLSLWFDQYSLYSKK